MPRKSRSARASSEWHLLPLLLLLRAICLRHCPQLPLDFCSAEPLMAQAAGRCSQCCSWKQCASVVSLPGTSSLPQNSAHPPAAPAAPAAPAIPPPRCRPSWDDQDHIEGNYQRSGLVMDVNAAFGRNARRDVLRDKVAQHPELLEAEPDDEIKAACAQVGGCWRAVGIGVCLMCMFVCVGSQCWSAGGVPGTETGGAGGGFCGGLHLQSGPLRCMATPCPVRRPSPLTRCLPSLWHTCRAADAEHRQGGAQAADHPPAADCGAAAGGARGGHPGHVS